MATNIICFFFFFNSCDLSCIIFPFADVLYCWCGFSAASRFNFTPSRLLRGIYVWRVMAGNFNAQLIMSQNKWGSSSTVHSRWQVTFTWVAELGICQHHAGLLELLEAMAACRCSKLRHNILGCFSLTAQASMTFEGHIYFWPEEQKTEEKKNYLCIAEFNYNPKCFENQTVLQKHIWLPTKVKSVWGQTHRPQPKFN